MKKVTNHIWMRIATWLMVALMLFSAMGQTGVEDTNPLRHVLPSAVAEAGNDLDGTRIETLSIQWITEDSTDKPETEAVGDAPVTSLEHLYLAPDTADPVEMKYQVEVAFSGQYDYQPGDITLRIPAQVIHGRTIANGEGTVDPDSYLDTLALPVPQAPSTKADFNWELVDGEYIITNTCTIGATSTATFQFTIKDVNPLDVVDMAVSDPIQATVEVKTNQGNVISAYSKALTAQIDTYAKVTAAYKNNENFFDGTNKEIPQAMYDALAERVPGANPEDYLYIPWYTYVYHEGNQPFTLSVEDQQLGAYLLDADRNKTQKVSEGILLGVTEYDGQTPTINGDTLNAVLFENDYCPDTKEAYEHTVYVWTAYPRADFTYAKEDDPRINYLFENEATWTVTEVDAATDDDQRVETTAEALGEHSFAPMEWSKPTGHFEVFKYTESKINKDWNYGYALNQLQKGEDVEMKFQLESAGYGYKWTSHLTYPGVVGPEQHSPEDYGLYGWRQVIEDYQTFVGFDGDPLTAEDYEIRTMTIKVPTLQIWGKRADATYGYVPDSSLPIPDLTIEYTTDGATWQTAATVMWGSDGKGEMQITPANGVTADGKTITFPENVIQTRHSFQSNVFGGNTVTPCDVAAITWTLDNTILLKADSEKVSGLVEQLFAADDNPTTKFKNDVKMDVYGWVGYEQAAEGGEQLPPEEDFYDSSRATLNGASYGVTMDKSMTYENDTQNKCADLHYTANVYEQSNLKDRAEYDEAVEAGVIAKETAGIWYDLLPPGVTPVMDSVQLRGSDSVTTQYAIPNYKGSGRTLLVVEADLTPVPEETDDGWRDVITISFDAVYSWESAKDLGMDLVNYIAFESCGENNDALGSVDNESGEPDNPLAGNNVTTPSMPSDVANAMTDLNPNHDNPVFVYSSAENTINVEMYAVSSLNKSVSNDLVGVWTQGLAGQEQVTVYEGQNYTYRLRVESLANTITRDIVIYDTIENYDIPAGDVTKADDYNDRESKKNWAGDWQGEGQWQGTLVSVDVSEFIKAGSAPVLYYAMQEINFPDTTNPNPSDVEMAELIAKPEYVLTSDLWTAAQVDANGLWTVPAGVKVTAIAIDASQTAAGGVFELHPGESMMAYLHMTAPDDNGDPNEWNAKGAYAHDASGNVDWEAAGDAENNMYAYNNARIISTQSDSDNTGDSARKMTRNDYTRVGILPGQVSIVKEWQDDNNHDGLRPDEVTVTLMRKAIGAAGTSQPVTGPDGQPLTVVLNETNQWKHTFYQIDVVDENGTPYLYSFQENEIPGYRLSVKNTGDTEYTLYNIHENEKVTIEGKKIWEDNDNAYGTRPDKVSIGLYCNGMLKTSVNMSAKENGEWSYRFADLDKYAPGGEEYRYEVREEYVPGYVATYVDGNLVNTYAPYGDLAISKAMAGGASGSTAFEFKLVLTREEDGENKPLTSAYDYKVFDENGMEVSSGTVSCNGTIQLSAGQKAVVYDLPSDASYRVEETAKPGYTQTKAENTSGMILAGSTAEVSFVNQYSASGSATIPVSKTFQGGAMNRGQFIFDLKDADGNVVMSASNGQPTDQDGASVAQATFTLNLTGEDVGKTYEYTIVERVPEETGGIVFDTAEFPVTVTVTDDGNGNLVADIAYPGGEPSFTNEYSASGSTEFKAWKVMQGGELEGEDFTFELYAYDEVTGTRAGEPVMTAKNDADGVISFTGLAFDQDDLSGDPENPNVYSYLLVEKDDGKEGIVYDKTEYIVRITPSDAGNGVLSFAQEVVDAQDNVVLPVFTNGAEPGSLSVTKQVTGTADPQQEFTFHVRLTGENLPEEIEYELSAAKAAISELLRTLPGNKAVLASAAAPGARANDYYVLSESDAALTPLARLDADGNLVIFRAAPNADGTYTFSDGVTITFTEGIYDVKSGDVYYYLLSNTENPSQATFNWPWFDEYSLVKTVSMEGGLKPASTSGMFKSPNLTSADLSMLDTSKVTDMSSMFSTASTSFNGSLTTLIGEENWDTSNVTNFASMFMMQDGITSIDVGGWDMSSGSNFQYMFRGCEALTQLDVSNWRMNTSATNGTFNYMFADCQKLTSIDVSGWTVDGIANMSYMFYNCYALTGPIDTSSWNTANVTTYRSMFQNCRAMGKIDASGLSLDKVTSTSGISSMFATGSSAADHELILGSGFVIPSNMKTQSFTNSSSKFRRITLTDKTISSTTSLPSPSTISPYTGKWVNVNDRTQTAATTAELFDGNHAGTWEWETSGVILEFAHGGGSGTMDPVTAALGEAVEITNGFDNFGYIFTGFQDELGNVFEDTDRDGKVTIPANTYTTSGTHTLTAQWEKQETKVEITDGLFTFTLHAGETATFPNLPAGTTYEVWEEVPAGWKLDTQTGTAGTIESGKTSEASFTNVNNSTNTLYIRAQAKKLVDGAPAAEAYQFKIYRMLGTTEFSGFAGTATNDGNGNIDLGEQSFNVSSITAAKPGPVTNDYLVKEIIPAEGDPDYDPDIEYDTSIYKLRVLTYFDATLGKKCIELQYLDADGNVLSGPPVFHNRTKPGSLAISKTIEGASDAAKDTEFTVQVSFTKDNLPWSGTIKNGETDVAVTNGVCSLTLKGGDTVTLSQIPAGVAYEAKETGTYPGWTLDTTVATGTIAANSTAEASFTNTYAATGSFSIKANKELIGRTLQEDEFSFQLYDMNTGSSDYNQAIDQTTNAENGTVLFGPISAAAPGTLHYEIREDAPQDDTIACDTEPLKVTVTLTDNGRGSLNAVVAFDGDDDTLTNTVKPGSLTVSKTVVNAPVSSTAKAFPFTLTLTGPDGTPFTETIDCNAAAVAQDGNRYTFTLADGDSIEFTNIPHGVQYVVTEGDVPGYTVISAGEIGTIAANETANASFTNTYASSGAYQLSLNKQLVGADMEAGQFTFVLMNESGYVLQTATNDANGVVSFAELLFTGEDVGNKTYKVAERSSGQAGMDYDETIHTITLTIRDMGDGTLEVVDNLPDGGIAFVNTYDDKTSHTVTKKWLDSDNLMGMRPENITVDLYQNDALYRENVVIAPIGDDWTYTFTELPAFDSSGVPYVYDVREQNVANYASNRVSNEDGTTITNALLGVLTVSKVVKEQEDCTEAFTFTLSLEKDGVALTDTFDYQILSEDGSVSVTGTISHGGAFELKDGEKIVITGLPIGTAYELEETENEDYYVEVTEGTAEGTVARYSSNQVTFANTYDPAVGSLKIVKSFSGLPEGTDVSNLCFKVTAPDGTETNHTYANFTNGELVIENLAVGEYTVTETNADGLITNYTLDTTASVTSGEATIAKDEEAIIELTNKYTQDVGSLKITKTFSGQPDDADLSKLSFTISDGTTNTVVTYADFPDGAYTIANIPVGTTYTVTETNADGLITNYSLSADSVTEGTAIIAKDTEAVIALTNTYTQDVGSLKITKTFEGTPADADLTGLSFTINDGTTDTVVTYADFTDGAYTIANIPVGTTYTVEETNAGTLIANYSLSADSVTSGEATIAKDEEAIIELTNKYTQDVGSLKITKTFEGTPAGADLTGLSFTISDGTTNTVVTYADFPDGAYTIANIPVGTVYTVTETNADTLIANYTLAASSVTEGTATTEKDKEATIELTNTYTYEASGALNLTATKTVNDAEPRKDQVFTFELLDAAGHVLQTKQNVRGSISFDAITYTEADIDKSYLYQVKEKQETRAGYTFDKTVYAVAVWVADNGDGTLKVSKTISREGKAVEAITFNNSYEASGELKLSATKTVNGAEPREDQVYEFTLTDAAGNTILAENVKGQITFDALTYNQSDAGKTYTYTVKETTIASDLLVVDESVYTVNVTVTDNKDGTLAVQPVITKDGEPAQAISFANILYAPLTISKTVEGCETTGTFPFTVELYDADGTEATGEYAYTGDVEGKLKSGDDIDLAHDQSVTISGLLPGMTYTVTEAATAAFETTVNGNAGNSIEGTLAENANEVSFVNKFKTTMFMVKKSWQGGGGGAIELTLYANGEKLEPQPVYTREDNTYLYTDLPMYDEQEQLIVYSAKEKYVDGFLTIYKNVAPYADETKAIYDGGTIINKVIVKADFSVKKEWSGLTEGETAPEITLVLYCNGVATDIETPKPDRNGWYKYYDLPGEVDGVKAVYTVKEQAVDGYVTSYKLADGTYAEYADNGGTITNAKIPQTGDETPLALWLTLMGTSAAMLMLLQKRRKA